MDPFLILAVLTAAMAAFFGVKHYRMPQRREKRDITRAEHDENLRSDSRSPLVYSRHDDPHVDVPSPAGSDPEVPGLQSEGVAQIGPRGTGDGERRD